MNEREVGVNEREVNKNPGVTYSRKPSAVARKGRRGLVVVGSVSGTAVAEIGFRL